MSLEPHPTDPEKLVFRANKHFIPTGIEALVCHDITQRQQLGIEKYGTTVADNPLTHVEWLQHAYEECLDMAVHLRRAIDQNQKEKPPQRKWIGITDKEFEDIIMSAPNATVPVILWQLIQDKLKEKNT